MAKPTSPVEICNLALSQLNQAPITSIEPPDEGSEAAAQCAAWYDAARLEALRAGTWAFARKRTTVVADADTPPFDFTTAYNLPNDFVRPVEVRFGGVRLNDDQYEIEDGQLLCNETGTLQLIYIYDHNNPAAWTPDFVVTSSTNLAKWVGPPLSANDGNTRLAEMRTEKSMRTSRAVNGQENRPKRVEYSRLMARRRRAANGTVMKVR